MPGLSAASIASRSASSLRRASWKRSTARSRFARSNPRTITAASRRPRRSTISARTGGAAVAVSASTGGWASVSIAAPRRRDAGREACPHSSIAGAPVVGTEGRPPLRDRVRLVDDDERRLRGRQLVEDLGVGELLGGEEQELERVLLELGERLLALALGQARVELRGAERAPAQRVDLVALQGDQRRDDERRAGGEQPGDLVDRRLARAGREDGERVAAREDALDRLALAGAQGFEAEHLAGGSHDPVRAALRHGGDRTRGDGFAYLVRKVNISNARVATRRSGRIGWRASVPGPEERVMRRRSSLRAHTLALGLLPALAAPAAAPAASPTGTAADGPGALSHFDLARKDCVGT